MNNEQNKLIVYGNINDFLIGMTKGNRDRAVILDCRKCPTTSIPQEKTLAISLKNQELV